MILAKPAWAAFKNMLRAAIRNPLWAFLSLIAAPFRVWKPLLQSFFILFVILFVVGLGGRMVLRDFGGFGPGSIPVIAWDGVTLLIMAVGVFLPMGPLADYFKLQALPWSYFVWLIGILLGYAFLTSMMKRYYIRRFGWQ